MAGIESKGCWYFHTVFECWECGKQKVYKERRKAPKPEKQSKRYSYLREHCGCLVERWY